jgi:hypothetical protein
MVVEKLIAKGGRWFGDHIVWGGDYAKPEAGVSDPDNPGRELNWYQICRENAIKGIRRPAKNYRFIINMDTNEYVDTLKVPLTDVCTSSTGKEYELRLHPLVILTCEGNGQGGGDYYKGENDPLVGSWARKRVSVSHSIPKGYTEVKCDFFTGAEPFKREKEEPKKEEMVWPMYKSSSS